MTLSRRELLYLASIGMAALPITAHAATVHAATAPLSQARPPDPADPIGVVGHDPIGALGTTTDPETLTLEAFADTLIPGAKRYPSDVAIAGVAHGAGAVQAGAVTFMRYPPTGVGALLPAFAVAVDAAAVAYAAEHGRVPDPTLPPFVGLRYPDRKAMLDGLLNHGGGEETLLWFALAGLVCLGYYTAGFESTADAVRNGHPGLTAIGFPRPDHDDLWRFPHFSYRRRLAHEHPHTTKTGQPR